MAKNKSRSKKVKKIILLTLLILVLVFVLALLVAVNLFTVKTVEVQENQLYEDQVIEDAVLNDDFSWNTLYVYLKYRFMKTEELPFVDTLEVSITGIHSLSIEVHEKAMMGYIQLDNDNLNVYFDTDGVVIEESQRVIPGVPQIIGISCEDAQLYSQLPVSDSIRKNLLTLTQTLKRSDLIPDSITYEDDEDPVLAYGNVRVAIGSNTNLTEKCERLTAILPQISTSSGLLHLENWSEENPDIIFDLDAGENLSEETSTENAEEEDGSQESGQQ